MFSSRYLGRNACELQRDYEKLDIISEQKAISQMSRGSEFQPWTGPRGIKAKERLFVWLY